MIDKYNLACKLEESSSIIHQLYQTIDNEEINLPAAERLLKAANEFFDRRQSNSEAKAVITELLQNNFFYNYGNYQSYVDDLADLQYCIDALLLFKYYEIQNITN